MSRGERVIFLDIDGVLINVVSLRNGNTAHPDCVRCLNRITDLTGAVIVVSSSWRKGGLKRIAKILYTWGVTGRVISITPDLSRDGNGVYIGATRGAEIQKWLEDNPVESFVILDDDTDMGSLVSRLVKTEYAAGLTPWHIERATEVLEQAPAHPSTP